MRIAWDNQPFTLRLSGDMVRRVVVVVVVVVSLPRCAAVCRGHLRLCILTHHSSTRVVESVQVLLECGANPNAQNTLTGATPLHCAIQSSKAPSAEGQLETVQALLKAGADPSRGDFFGSVPADYCQEDAALMDLLHVEKHPVFDAILEGNALELARLLQEDANVVHSRHDSLTPLLYVVDLLVQQDSVEVHVEMMRLLLENGADPNATPTANRNGHLTVQEDPGDAALHRICVAIKNNESLQSAALLLKQHNATVTHATQLLLHNAARRNQLDVCKFLLEKMEISPNIQGRQGMTPLQFAARSGKTEMVEFLLQQEGINVEIQDERGQTALDAARVNNNHDIVALLEQYSSAGKSA